LQNTQQYNRSKNHEKKDRVEQNGLQPCIFVQNGHRNLIVADHTVVDQHYRYDESLDSYAESRHLYYPHLHQIKSSLHWLYRGNQGVYVDLADVHNRQGYSEPEDKSEDQKRV
jgi:hypothetical protein